MSLPFPNVPKLPGVPQIPRLPGAIYAAVSLASSNISSLLGNAPQIQNQWGVFNSKGSQVIKPDSVVDFGNTNSWDLPRYPIQDGAFASFNKVIVPFEVMVRMTKGGEVTDRITFLQQIAAIAGDTNLYTVMTPEQSYANVNVTRYEYQRRGSAGAYFIDVDVYFVQINQTSAQYTSTTLNASDPTAQPATNQGAVQAQPVAPQVSSAISAAPIFNGEVDD